MEGSAAVHSSQPAPDYPRVGLTRTLALALALTLTLTLTLTLPLTLTLTLTHTVNLHEWLVGVRGGVVESVWPIDARGP